MTFPLPFFSPIVVIPTITYVSSADTGNNNVLYTFSAMALGTPTTKIIVVYSQNDSGAAGAGPTSVTVGGNSATQRVSASGTSPNEQHISFWTVETASTTGDVVLLYSDGQVRAAVSVYNIEGYSSLTPAQTDSEEFNGASGSGISLTVGATQVALCAATQNDGGSNASSSWTGATEDADGNFGGDSGPVYTAAHVDAGAGAITPDVTFTNSERSILLGAVWG